MRNPSIILNTTCGTEIRINVNHIVTYDQRKRERTSRNQAEQYYTYIVLMGGNAITRSVEETPQLIDALIADVYQQEYS